MKSGALPNEGRVRRLLFCSHIGRDFVYKNEFNVCGLRTDKVFVYFT